MQHIPTEALDRAAGKLAVLEAKYFRMHISPTAYRFAKVSAKLTQIRRELDRRHMARLATAAYRARFDAMKNRDLPAYDLACKGERELFATFDGQVG